MNMADNEALPSKQIKWYLKPVPILVAVLLAGPLAIPLVWASPIFKKRTKVLIIIGLIVVTILIIKSYFVMYKILKNEILDLQKVLNQLT